MGKAKTLWCYWSRYAVLAVLVEEMLKMRSQPPAERLVAAYYKSSQSGTCDDN